MRLHGLDALRGIAAICVLGYHIHTVYGGLTIFSRSYLAVDFFFMLSGFVMARTYEPRFAGGLSTLSFFIKRFARLWGPMAIGTMVGFTVAVSVGMPLFKGIAFAIAGLAFVPFLATRTPFPLNGPAWSIFFELVANIAHAAIFTRLSIAQLIAVSALCCVALFLHHPQHLLVGHIVASLPDGVARVFLSYCLGIVLFRIGKVSSLPICLSQVLLPAAMLSMALTPRSLLTDLGFVIGICPIVLFIAAQPCSNEAAKWLGRLSFPLYAVHYPIIKMGHLLHVEATFAAICAVGLAILIEAIAILPRRLRPAR